MGYYVRFFVADSKPIDMAILQAALRRLGSLELPPDEPRAELLFEGEPHGLAEISRPGGGLFEDEISESQESLKDGEGRRKARVETVLQNSKAIIAVQVLFGERGTTATLERFMPVWGWLFSEYSGLLQVDGEGFYDATGELAFEFG